MKVYQRTVQFEVKPNLVIRVKGIYSPPVDGKMYLSNGDPGYPDEPAEFYIQNVELVEGDILDFIDYYDDSSATIYRRIENAAIESLTNEDI